MSDIELDCEADQNKSEGHDGSYVRKDIKIQLKPKISEKPLRSPIRIKKTLKFKKTHHSDNHSNSNNTNTGHTKSNKKSLSYDEMKWDHPVDLIGKVEIIPNVDLCQQCTRPIINYGRMKPCKHAFCYSCAKEAKTCPKCNMVCKKVENVEFQKLYLCHYGSQRYSVDGCISSYKSPRDLESHVKFRHNVDVSKLENYPNFLKILHISEIADTGSTPQNQEQSESANGANSDIHSDTGSPSLNDNSINNEMNRPSTPEHKILPIPTKMDVSPIRSHTRQNLPTPVNHDPTSIPLPHPSMFQHNNIRLPQQINQTPPHQAHLNPPLPLPAHQLQHPVPLHQHPTPPSHNAHPHHNPLTHTQLQIPPIHRPPHAFQGGLAPPPHSGMGVVSAGLPGHMAGMPPYGNPHPPPHHSASNHIPPGYKFGNHPPPGAFLPTSRPPLRHDINQSMPNMSNNTPIAPHITLFPN